MKNKLFGQNINPDCAYCENAVFENDFAVCTKNKRIQKGKCRSFKYDPLLRIPKNIKFTSSYAKDDFVL
ncbi:MAG: hypothetical protein LUF33_05845 [Clostridiales bacterium]|nr:hypothetical protein [Clostridiales bacterium]